METLMPRSLKLSPILWELSPAQAQGTGKRKMPKCLKCCQKGKCNLEWQGPPEHGIHLQRHQLCPHQLLLRGVPGRDSYCRQILGVSARASERNPRIGVQAQDVRFLAPSRPDLREGLCRAVNRVRWVSAEKASADAEESAEGIWRIIQEWGTDRSLTRGLSQLLPGEFGAWFHAI